MGEGDLVGEIPALVDRDRQVFNRCGIKGDLPCLLKRMLDIRGQRASDRIEAPVYQLQQEIARPLAGFCLDWATPNAASIGANGAPLAHPLLVLSWDKVRLPHWVGPFQRATIGQPHQTAPFTCNIG
ncbi:hypothetical protein [Sinorhizobium sp. 8-89]|uniref:hypothetical protein n=1 Tax=Sinorhizobium sp. 8-89 TaxID=3049089 RepID=UPI0024C2749E|nr:hypothetical protein [Sinorhizobium sp. 8-89]